MNIVYTCDNNYVWLMGISMISLFENSKDSNEISVYLIGDNISEKNKFLLLEIAERYQRTIIIKETPNLNIPEKILNKRWPKSAYTRLFLGEILPNNIKKVIYLDCDTVILDNIESLWSVDIEKVIVAGVLDCIGKKYKKNIGIDKNGAYINAGVLVFNLDNMRKVDMSIKVNKFLEKYSSILSYSDQDVLNGIMKDNVSIINAKYNVMTILCEFNYEDVINMRHPNRYYEKYDILNAVNKPAIVHYTTCMTSIRPWFKNSNHLFKREFLQYKESSPWKSKELIKLDKDTSKNKILKTLLNMPKVIGIPIIGCIHSIMVPYYTNLKSKILKLRKE